MKTQYDIVVIFMFLLCLQVIPVNAVTGIVDTGAPPVIISQVELWGPVSFYTGGVHLCLDNRTSLGPWAVGWLELYNTKNETIFMNDLDIKTGNGEGGYTQVTLGPYEHCYITTQDILSTRVGVGGSLGNDAPDHSNDVVTISYSVQPFAGKFLYTYSTPSLSDNYGDTRTWQQIDGRWVFKEANLIHSSLSKMTLSPSRQMQYGINAKDLNCNGLTVLIKKSDPTNWYLHDVLSCVRSSTASKLVERGWGMPLQNMSIPNTNSTLVYYSASKINQVVPDLLKHSLHLILDANADSKIVLFVPRSFVDSPEIGNYASFNVTSNGDKTDYHEHLTPTDRVFTLLLKNDTTSILITPLPFIENQG
jgi:hypothetical protein